MLKRPRRHHVALAPLVVLGMACSLAPDPLFASDPGTSVPIATIDFAATLDEGLSQSWADHGVSAAPLCSDEQFVRRVYLDLLGRIPRVSEARDFLEDERPDRRRRLVRSLLERPGYATRLTNLWRVFLLPANADDRQATSSAGFESWLRDRFASNSSYDQIARELLMAEGSPAQSGPALYYTAWELKPEKLAGSTARAFLGIQLQCAECHDHPFTNWSQTDFWSYAAFFARLQPNEALQIGFREALDGELTMPDEQQPILPKYLGGSLATDTRKSRRELLSEWMTDAGNPYFAQAAVNRVWFMLFGRGLVDPPDDMGAHNPSLHQALLARLAQQFQRQRYDLRWLVTTLCNSHAYQLASGNDKRQLKLFACMHTKVFTAEQLYDSLTTAVCQRQADTFSGPTFGLNRVLQQGRKQFLSDFRSPSTSVTEYRRGIAQAMTLMNGQMVDAETSVERSALLGSLQSPLFSDADRIDTIFLAVLSRYPSESEREQVTEHLTRCNTSADRRALFSDLLWAIVNSTEFVLNR